MTPNSIPWKAVTLLTIAAAATVTVTAISLPPCTAAASSIRRVATQFQQSSQLICTLSGSGYSVAFSRDGQTLASASSNAIKLWNPRTGTLSRTLSEHSQVWSLAFNPDGQILASGSQDGTLNLWNWRTGELIRTLRHSDPVIDVVFSPDGQTLSSGLDLGSNIRLWNWRSGEPIRIPDDPNTKKIRFDPFKIEPVALSPDGQTFVAKSGSGSAIRLWNQRTGKLIRTFQADSTVYSVAISRDGQTLAVGIHDKAIKLWKLGTGELIGTLAGHSDEVHSVAFSPNGEILASGSRDNTVKLWNLRTGELISTFTGHSALVWSVAFSPDGEILASGSQDGTIKLWRISL